MNNLGWARCTDRLVDVLRRGAWYPVVAERPDGTVVIQVEATQVDVRREHLRIRSDPPSHWSVVVRTGVMRPTWSGASNGSTYAVCPHCRERQYFEGKPDRLECRRCRRSAPVDWSETC